MRRCCADYDDSPASFDDSSRHISRCPAAATILPHSALLLTPAQQQRAAALHTGARLGAEGFNVSIMTAQSVRNCNWDAQQLQQHMDSHRAAPCSYSELWARIKLLLARTVSALPQVSARAAACCRRAGARVSSAPLQGHGLESFEQLNGTKLPQQQQEEYRPSFGS